jgi:signal transduction histidine kinase
VVDAEPRLAAAWPLESAAEPGGTGVDLPRVRSEDVGLDGVLLGVLRLQEIPDQPLSPVEEHLFAGLAAQAGLVLRGAQLRAELAGRAHDLATLADDLQASRRRVVDAHDSERRRLERDIHDGAQQHLVALVVNLRLAHTLSVRSPDRAQAVLAEQQHAVDNAITSLVDLSRGIYPLVLSEEGVAAAVRDVVASSTIPVTVVDHGIGRLDADLETALYFCCVEAVQNAVKHASAGRIKVDLADAGDRIELRVRDDGHGFDVRAVVEAGGLGNLRDRVDSMGGDLDVSTNDVGGTDVLVSVGRD